MASPAYEVEASYRVCDNQHGGYIGVCPDRDGLGCVELYTDAKSEEHFGAARLVMQPAMARVLVAAITRCIEDVERAEARARGEEG